MVYGCAGFSMTVEPRGLLEKTVKTFIFVVGSMSWGQRSQKEAYVSGGRAALYKGLKVTLGPAIRVHVPNKNTPFGLRHIRLSVPCMATEPLWPSRKKVDPAPATKGPGVICHRVLHESG